MRGPQLQLDQPFGDDKDFNNFSGDKSQATQNSKKPKLGLQLDDDFEIKNDQ